VKVPTPKKESALRVAGGRLLRPKGGKEGNSQSGGVQGSEAYPVDYRKRKNVGGMGLRGGGGPPA